MRPFRSVPVLMAACAALSFASPVRAGVTLSVSVGIPPPPLPVYAQPPCPADGYIWTPGYWAYGPDGYFWVPGTWVLVPEPGFLWTPCYWGWSDGVYLFHPGYWGPVVGFYGGINYGYGYGGYGYQGGYWNRGRFFYNRAVNNVTRVRVVNVYNRAVPNAGRGGRVSFNGGAGGVRARPTADQQRALSGRRLDPTSAQSEQVSAAAGNRQLLASVNHGRPAIAATRRSGEFRDSVPARGANQVEAPGPRRERGRETQSSRERPQPRPPAPQDFRSSPRGDRFEPRPQPRQELREQRRPEPRQQPRMEQRSPQEREERGRGR